MSNDPQQFLTGTIDDYLLALADGVVQAQRQLSAFPVESFNGQAPVLYQIPKVDFELRLTFELDRETTTPASSRNPVLRKRVLLKARPVGSESKETFNAQAVSTIKGSFVAMPAHGGKPPPVLRLQAMSGDDAATLAVEISLRNTAGQPIAGQLVDLGIDRDFSSELNTQNGLPAARRTLSAETEFEQSQVVTDADGNASVTLSIASVEAPGASIVIEAYAGPLGQAIIHQIPERT